MYIKQFESKCLNSPLDQRYYLEIYVDHHWIVQSTNSARSECSYKAFQSFYLRLALAEVILDVGKKKEVIAKRDSNKRLLRDIFGNFVRSSKTIPVPIFHIQNRYVRTVFEDIKLRIKTRKSQKKKSPIELGLRSPKRFLYYLGHLVSLSHNKGPNSFRPTMVSRNSEPGTIIFYVPKYRHIEGPRTRGQIKIHGPDKRLYVVDPPVHGAMRRDLTMRVLTLAQELVNSAVSQTGLPTPTTVLVR